MLQPGLFELLRLLEPAFKFLSVPEFTSAGLWEPEPTSPNFDCAAVTKPKVCKIRILKTLFQIPFRVGADLDRKGCLASRGPSSENLTARLAITATPWK